MSETQELLSSYITTFYIIIWINANVSQYSNKRHSMKTYGEWRHKIKVSGEIYDPFILCWGESPTPSTTA
jgi:hypothetical protein